MKTESSSNLLVTMLFLSAGLTYLALSSFAAGSYSLASRVFHVLKRHPVDAH